MITYVKVRIDKVAGAAYITLVLKIRKGEACKQVIAHGGDVILDFDKQGRLLGIELLSMSMLHPDLAEGDVVETHAR